MDDEYKVTLEMRVGNTHRGYDFARAAVSTRGQFLVVQVGDKEEQWFHLGSVVRLKKEALPPQEPG